jgi:hypothetical protein
MSEEITRKYVLNMPGKNIGECYDLFFGEFVGNHMGGDSKIDNYSFGQEADYIRLNNPVYATVIRTSGFPLNGEHNFVLDGENEESVEKVFNRINRKGFNLEEVVEEKK